MQGSFSAAFSLTQGKESENQYEYTFYGDGQGSEKNTSSGETVFFTYTAFDRTLTINTDHSSRSYKYKLEEKKDINITYQKEGRTESVLLVKK